MNIAIFTDCFVPTKNGVVTSITQLQEGLEAKGHKVYVITVDVPNYEEKSKHVYRLPSFKAALGKGTEQRVGYMINQGAINRFLKKKMVSIIHTHTEFPLGYTGKKAAAKLGIPCVHTTHTMWEEYRHYILNGKLITKNMARKIISNYLKGIYAIVAPSIKAKKYYADLTPEIPSVVINNGIDMMKFKSSVITESEISQLRREFNIQPDDKTLIFVGRIGKEKRVDILFEKMANILKKDKSYKMLLVGDGPILETLAAKAEDYNIKEQVVFTGFVNWELVFRLYSIASIFVTASLSEVQPMTLIEAAMCNLPLIVRKDDSYLDLVKPDYNGYLADSDEELEKFVEELLTDDKKMAQFAENSFTLSKNFTADIHVGKMEKFYEKIITAYPGKFDGE